MLNATFNMNTDVVRDESGNVDVEKTTAKFAAVLVEFSASVKADNDTIRHWIDKVYDMQGNNDKKCLPVTYLIHQVVGKLGAGDTQAAFDLALERVQSFIKDSGLFGSVKGPKGGLFRKYAPEAAKTEETKTEAA